MMAYVVALIACVVAFDDQPPRMQDCLLRFRFADSLLQKRLAIHQILNQCVFHQVVELVEKLWKWIK